MNDRDHDLDAEFERIIAGWDDEAPDPLPAARRAPSTDDAAAAPGSPDSPDADPAAPTDGVDDVDDVDDVTAQHDAAAGDEESGTAGAPDGPAPATPPASSASPAAAAPPAQPGTLGLPIASTTSHAWRGSEPTRDDVDDLLEDPDDHFVPPETDLPSAEDDPMFWAIVGGLVGGPLLLLWVILFDREGSGWWVVTGAAMVVVGFVLLVLRGGNERDPFDDGTRI